MFKKITEYDMVAQPLSEETIKLADVAVSRKTKICVNEMLKKLSKMTRNRGFSIPRAINNSINLNFTLFRISYTRTKITHIKLETEKLKLMSRRVE